VVDRRAPLRAAPRRPVRPGARLLRWLTSAGILVVLLAGASVTGLLPVQVARIDAGSMAPTVDGGDLVLLARGDRAPVRGDVVAAREPGNGGLLVKRVVAVGGDTVAIQDGVLVVDGEPVCEPWSDPDRIDGVYHGAVDVPVGEVFLLSDDRRLTYDSRAFGPVAVQDLEGRVIRRLWPSPGALPVDPC
jgi:signal peptidase I